MGKNGVMGKWVVAMRTDLFWPQCPVKVSCMKTRNEILDSLARIKPALCRQYGLRNLALFGSYARGDQQESSDVDVLVEVDPSVGLRFVDLADDIERAVGLPTDVVSRRALPPRHFSAIAQDLVHV